MIWLGVINLCHLQKSLKYSRPTPLPSLRATTQSRNTQFWYELPPLLNVVNWHSITPG